MAERSFRFGDDARLLGTLTPVSAPVLAGIEQSGVEERGIEQRGVGRGGRGRIGVLLLNSGVIHRIGPHRINVKLARHLAARGLPGLRFDLSGLGDSHRPAEPRPMGEQAMRDLRAAADQLCTETGVDRILLIGICSAAEYGYLYALQDDRISDLVMIDGYSFPNLRTRLLRYGYKIRSARPHDWGRALAGRLQRLIGSGRHGGAAPVDFGLPDIDARGFADGLGQLVARGARVYLIYTGSILQRYNHDSQFRDVMLALPGQRADERARLEQVRCDYVPDIDHTLTPLRAQRELIARIERWLREPAAYTANRT